MLCLFAKFHSLVKSRLFTAYCSCFYGSELWNLDSSEIDCLVCVRFRGKACAGCGGFTR